MIHLPLTLDYQLNAGWLAPYVNGLKNGILVAQQCSSCSRTSVPPTRSCPCGASDGCWKTLSGTARIIKRTTGADGDFAMVRFDGADTLSVVALESVSPSATTAVIKPATGDLPRLVLITESGPDKHDIE